MKRRFSKWMRDKTSLSVPLGPVQDFMGRVSPEVANLTALVRGFPA
jgi:hypothetical protein